MGCFRRCQNIIVCECFQSPPKGGEASAEASKDCSAPVSEPSSQEATPEKSRCSIMICLHNLLLKRDCSIELQCILSFAVLVTQHILYNATYVRIRFTVTFT